MHSPNRSQNEIGDTGEATRDLGEVHKPPHSIMKGLEVGLENVELTISVTGLELGARPCQVEVAIRAVMVLGACTHDVRI